MKFTLTYDKKTLDVEIDDRNVVGVLQSKVEGYKPVGSQEELIEASLDSPIGSPKLEELAKGKKNIVIISSDHTRPVPSKIITPILLRRIREAQPDANIKILVATGFHRPSTHQELVDKYGEEILEREQIVMHVSTTDADQVRMGLFLPAGNASSTALRRRQIFSCPRASSNRTCSQVFPEAASQCCPESPRIRQSWRTTAANSSTHRMHVRGVLRTIPFTPTCCTRPKPCTSASFSMSC
jgi:Lactate racemase N-terminal domain